MKVQEENFMSQFQTIHTVDITDQNAVHQFLSEIPSGVHYSLVRNGTEVAKVVPVEEKNDKVSDEVTKQRLEVMAKVDILAKRIAEHWSTDETAVEAILNDRDASVSSA